METTLFDYAGETFPKQISVGFRNMPGFVNKNGQVTNKVLVMSLSSVDARTQNGYTTRDLVYKSSISTTWSLGTMR